MPADIEQLADPAASAAQETRLVGGLAERAGLQKDAAGNYAIAQSEWPLIFKAGVRVVDGQCDQYLDALFRFNREQRAGRQGLAAAAGATGSIMGIAGAASGAIAITAAAFGLTSSLFDASVNSVLFTIEPSALRNVALQGRRAYLDAIRGQPITSRPDAMIALQGYLTQCSPAAIEANINNAASGAPSVVQPEHAQEAATLAAPSATLLSPVQQQVILSPTRPLPPAPAQPVAPPETTPREQINLRMIPDLQTALCVTPANGRMGGLPGSSAPTRVAIRNFLAGRSQGFLDPGTLAASKGDELVPSDRLAALHEAIDRATTSGSVRPCSDPSRGYQNAFEVGLYGSLPDPDRTAQIAALQAKLRKVLGDAAGVPSTGKLDPATRQAIDETRAKLAAAGPRGALDPVLYKRLLAIPD